MWKLLRIIFILILKWSIMTNNRSLKFNLQLSIAESETTIDKLDIDFKIFKNNKPEANSAYLNIWNLNDTVFHKLVEKENLIDVYAGFGEDDPGLMFRGYIELDRTFNGRPPDRVDCATLITLKDGKRAFETFINKNYREKVTTTTLIQDCISTMGIGLGSLSENLVQTQFDSYKIYGYPQNELGKICNPLGISYSIQNNLIQIVAPDEKFEGTDTLIFNSENSARLQKKGTDEIVIITSLTPGLDPNDWIQCEFDEFKGTARVKEVYHHGNNYGQTCVTEITIGYKNND